MSDDKHASKAKGVVMGSYVKAALIKDERVLYSGRVSLWALTPLIVLGVLLMPIMGLGLVFWLIAIVRYYTTELAITNKRVISKFGLIRRDTIEVNAQKVESVQVDQSVIGRIFNFGTIIIAGAGDPKAPIPGISNPMAFRRAFFENQESAGQVA